LHKVAVEAHEANSSIGKVEELVLAAAKKLGVEVIE
jgi:hypothetical protein